MNKEFKIYHVKTKEDYDDLMVKLEEQGCRWRDGDKPTSGDSWTKYGKETVVFLGSRGEGILTRGHISRVKTNYSTVPIIKYKAKGVEQMEKVVVPQFVADWYEEFSNNSLGFKISELSHVSKRMEQWINSLETDYRCGMEIAQEVIAKMHLYGYEVEEENKYYWRKKKEYMFDFEDDEERSYLRVHIGTGEASFGYTLDYEGYESYLTETEVKRVITEEDFNKLEKVEFKDV